MQTEHYHRYQMLSCILCSHFIFFSKGKCVDTIVYKINAVIAGNILSVKHNQLISTRLQTQSVVSLDRITRRLTLKQFSDTIIFQNLI